MSLSSVLRSPCARAARALGAAALVAPLVLAAGCKDEPKGPVMAPAAVPPPSAGRGAAPQPPAAGDPEPRGPVVGPLDFLWARDAAAPAMELATLDGKGFSLAKEKGKVVFVNFWATWCPPCVDEMPSMLALGTELEKRYPDKFRMVAVSADREEGAARAFFSAPPYGGSTGGVTVALDPGNATTQAYFCAARGGCPPSFAFPETYIVKDGKIVSFLWGPRDWKAPEARAYLEKLITG